MKFKHFFIAIFLVVSFFGLAKSSLAGQLWSGVLDPSRAIDWSKAGLPSTFPDGETTANPWTPPERTTICATIAPMGSPTNFVAPTEIQNAEASCPPSGVVQLQAGSFYLTSLPLHSPDYPNTVNGITLRGAGADKTFVYLNGSGSAGLGGMQNAPSVTVTGGLSQGSTELTLSGSVPVNTLLSLSQCNTGFSGSTCSNSTDSQVDNGGLWICTGDGQWCSHGGTGNEGGPGQVQIVKVTASNGNTVTISPGIYLPNWNTANTATAYFFTPPVYGVGLESMTVDQTSSTGVSTSLFCLGCWMKGMRFINSKLVVGGSEHYLIANSYFADYGGYKDGYGVTLMDYGFGDGLILNNIFDNLSLASNDAGSGAVYAYNYLSPTNTSIFNHVGGTSFNLAEGNEGANFDDDNIHGNHNLTTLFRNRFTSSLGNTSAGYAVQLGQGTRFSNIIGNVLGTTGFNESYEHSPATLGSPGSIYDLGIGAVLGYQGVPYDSLVSGTLFRWGNVTAYGGSVHGPSWSASEVPSDLNAATGYQQQIGTGDGSQKTFTGTLEHLPAIAPSGMVYDRNDALYAYDSGNGTLINNVSAGNIDYVTGAVTVTFTTAPKSGSPVYINYLQQTGNASPYRNPVPGSQSLPLSFIFPNLKASSNGTDLPFGKVCTNYSVSGGCGGAYYHFPMPGIGPDVTGGNGPGGYSYDIPAKAALSNLPIDPSYQKSYSITGSSWSNGMETLTVSGFPSSWGDYMTRPLGQFDVTGTSGCNGTKFQITASTNTTVSYALASDPGSCSGGTFKFPNVRVFNESVYQNDSSQGGDTTAPNAPSGLTVQ